MIADPLLTYLLSSTSSWFWLSVWFAHPAVSSQVASSSLSRSTSLSSPSFCSFLEQLQSTHRSVSLWKLSFPPWVIHPSHLVPQAYRILFSIRFYGAFSDYSMPYFPWFRWNLEAQARLTRFHSMMCFVLGAPPLLAAFLAVAWGQSSEVSWIGVFKPSQHEMVDLWKYPVLVSYPLVSSWIQCLGISDWRCLDFG